MKSGLEESWDVWRDDFDEMAESVHMYILDSLDEDVDYSKIEDNRREVETGYRYSGGKIDFKFSLAGTVNSNPEVLREGKRKIVFQTENENKAYNELLEDIEKNASSVNEKEFEDLEISMFEIEPPYD